MTQPLLFDFSFSKETQTATIVREFAADRDLVWDAFTKAEILDQWWAPQPWASRTKYMNFTEGGKRFYAMVSPEGVERWQLQTYSAIHPKTDFKMYSAFADANENPELPGSEWDYRFSEKDGITTVKIKIYNESLERMEKMIAMGFQGGMTATLAGLEKLLAKLKS